MAETPDASERLELLTSQFQGLLDAAVDGIIMIDEHGRIQVFNRAAERIFGFSANEVQGKNVTCLMPSPYAEEHDQYIAAYLASHQAKIIGSGREVRGKRRNGEVFPMNLAVGEVSTKGKVRFVGLVRDITERKRIEQRLETLDQEFQFLFQRVPVGLLLSRFDGTLLMVNPWLIELLGVSESELLRTPFAELVQRADRGVMKSLLQSLASGVETRREFATAMLTKTGDPCFVNLNASVVTPNQGGGIILAVITDRTAEMLRLANANEVRERLAHSDRLNSLGEMASAIAHEINQPLAAITAYANACSRLLGTTAGHSNEINDVLGKISEQAQRGGEVVRRIRGFATRGNKERVIANINELINGALALVEANAKGSDVAIETNFCENLPRVLVDEIQIQQVCINLIRNAIDAMSVQPAETRKLTISSRLDGGEIDVCFEDHGPGVPEPIRARLFEPFQSSKDGGLGLGLSISHKIISDHRGSLSYEPAESGGSRFRFRLPQAAD